MQNEPIRLMARLTAALTATLSLLAFFGVPGELVGALNVAASAWVIVGFEFVRARVDGPQTVARKEAELTMRSEPAPAAVPTPTPTPA
jgi:hypothetical protein